jgi:hypothetical protein
MGLHFWLIPTLGVLVIAIWLFYSIVKRTGGPGVRTDGRTVVHKTEHDEENLPPA